MLSVTHQELLMRIRATLAGSKDAELTALAKELDALLLSDAATRASVSRRKSKGGTDASGRTPTVNYAIEVEPGSTQRVVGSHAAHVALGEALRAAGVERRLPALHSLRVSMSRNGHWSTLADTDNGTVSVTLRRLGTEDANSKKRAKNPKTT